MLLAEQEPQKAFPHGDISDGDHAARLWPAGYTDSQGVLHALTSPRGLCCFCLSSCSHGDGSKRTFFQNFLQLFFSALQAVGYIVGLVADHGGVLDKRKAVQVDRDDHVCVVRLQRTAQHFALFLVAVTLICRELSYRCGGDYELLPVQLDALAETVENGEYAPCLINRDGKPFDFSFLRISQYGEAAQTELCESFSQLLDAFYSRRDQQEQQRRRGRELQRSVKSARDRLARKLAGQREDFRKTETREEVRRRAELVTANLYRIRRGDRSLVCEDYYEPDCPEISIALDPLKTPQQNAAALYKEYGKLKGARQHLSVLIEQGEQQLDYLNSVLDELERAESEKDLSDIRRELSETGYLRRQKGARTEKGRAQTPLRFVTDAGLEVLVGRSNVQNDELTTKLARRTDYWLHTQRVHGSHVILRCEGQEPDEASLEQAASIAAYYSQGREAGKIPVDCTMVRFVRKPSGSLPGKVIYTDYHTILAEADEALVNRLKK